MMKTMGSSPMVSGEAGPVTYKVGRVQDAVLHRVGQVKGELPGHPPLGPLDHSLFLLL